MNNITVLSDNGVQIFMGDFIEKVLADAYNYDYSGGTRTNRWSDTEICDMHDISLAELIRIKNTLSYKK